MRFRAPNSNRSEGRALRVRPYLNPSGTRGWTRGARPADFVLLLAAWLMTFSVQAQTVLSVGSAPAYPGASISVPVSLIRPTNVVAAQFDIAFDPARVASGSAQPDPASPRHSVLSREIAPGVRRVLVYSTQNLAITNRNPAYLPFTVSPNEHVGSGPLTPRNAILARGNGTAAPPPTLASGTIFVRPVNLLPDGRVQFFLPSTPDQRYYIQASSDLSSWVNISTNVATGTFLDLIDLDASSYPYRFYRWQSAP